MRPLKQWQRIDELKRTTTITDCSLTADAHNTKQRHSERPIYGPQYIFWDDTSSYPRKLYSETYQTRWRRRSKRTYYLFNSNHSESQWIQANQDCGSSGMSSTTLPHLNGDDAIWIQSLLIPACCIHPPGTRRLWVRKTPGRQYQYKECPYKSEEKIICYPNAITHGIGILLTELAAVYARLFGVVWMIRMVKSSTWWCCENGKGS